MYWKNKQLQNIAALVNPPGAYMQNSGIKCPDYWVYTGTDKDGNYICNNSFNIPTVTTLNPACNTTQLNFNPVQPGYTWEMGNPDGLTSYTYDQMNSFVNTSGAAPLSRCQWINSCGPATNVQGIWTGVNEVCNTPITTPVS